MSSKELVARPAPNARFSAAALGAWQTRAQQSTLFVPMTAARELLRDVVVFVRGARGTQDADAVGPVALDQRPQPLGDERTRLVPRDAPPLAVRRESSAR